jgi:hypothetical protein
MDENQVQGVETQEEAIPNGGVAQVNELKPSNEPTPIPEPNDPTPAVVTAEPTSEQAPVEQTKPQQKGKKEKEAKNGKKGEVPIVENFTFVGDVELKLQIHENKVIPVPKDIKKVVVTNLGGGDLYVSALGMSFSSENLLQVGEEKEFIGAERLFVGTASRPKFRISNYK